jgi:hypothetical protein
MTRALLVLACVAFVLLVLAAMRLGWRNRAHRQSALLPELVPVPADLGTLRLGPDEGLYVGSSFAASWQDRVVYQDLGSRAAARISWYDTGLLVDRDGARPVFVPAGEVTEARLAAGLAGKVVGAGGLLVLQWRCGDQLIDTGFRADDKRTYPQWVDTINGRRVAS